MNNVSHPWHNSGAQQGLRSEYHYKMDWTWWTINLMSCERRLWLSTRRTSMQPLPRNIRDKFAHRCCPCQPTAWNACCRIQSKQSCVRSFSPAEACFMNVFVHCSWTYRRAQPALLETIHNAILYCQSTNCIVSDNAFSQNALLETIHIHKM